MAAGFPRSATHQRHALPVRFAAIWLALTVALLSSLLSSGLPRTTALGSAFNPATTAVALKPARAQPRVIVEQVRRDDNPSGGHGATATILPASVQPVVHFATAVVPPKPMAVARPIAPHAVLDGSPRGPPLPGPFATSARRARAMENVMEQSKKKRPPWWFAPAIWGGIAGSAAIAAAVIGAAVE